MNNQNEKLFDEYPEWVGMPEFDQQKKEPFKILIVRFETEEDYKEFQARINQPLTNKTKSIWYPYRSHWGAGRSTYEDAS